MNKILTGFETLSGLQKYFSAPFRLTKFEYYSLSSRRIDKDQFNTNNKTTQHD